MRLLPSLRDTRWRRPVRLFFASCWLAAVAFGFSQLDRFERTPGVEAPTPAIWPETPALVKDEDRLNVVVALHPKCPCSMATLESLEGMVERHPTAARFHFLFFRPSSGAEAWHETELWREARQFPGAACILDVNGMEASRFGAVNSGTVAAYSGDGRLVFKGGVTPSRGAVGPNRGADVLTQLMKHDGDVLLEQHERPDSCPVFGCPLVPQVTFRPDAINVRM
jgi:hypothetical protein